MKSLEQLQIEMCPHKPSFCLSGGNCSFYTMRDGIISCSVADFAHRQQLTPAYAIGRFPERNVKHEIRHYILSEEI